jgi:cell division protein FtsB
VVRTRRTTRLAILGLIALALVVAVAPTLRAYLHQRGQISALEAQQAQQRRDVAALQAQAQRWNDPAYVEAQARARLQFVRPGQRSYIVSLPKPKAAPPPASGVVGGTTGTSGRSWMDGLWQSVQKAGATNASAG